MRPMTLLAGVEPGGCSLRLTRLIVDLGVEDSFVRSAGRVLEHHGVSVSPSLVRKLTLKHAKKAGAAAREKKAVTVLPSQGVDHMEATADGSFVPVVECGGEPGKDRRKHRKTQWKEMKIAAAWGKGRADVFYACSFNSAEELGRLWTQIAVLAGWGANTEVLGLSDGAEWIARLIEICFGRRARHLIDLFHVCEYLAAASPVGDEKSRRRWLRAQKKRLLAGKLKLVLEELRPRCEAPALADEESPVRAALRYLEKRPEKLDYPFAVNNGLSVGSGLIEGAHRHLIQKRLKISGAWWLKENADDLAQLRVLRANGKWETFWHDQRKAA